MADIDLERKSGGGMGWLWAVLAVIALALILWAVWPEPEIEPELVDLQPVETAPVAPPTAVAVAGLPIAQILSSPDDWVGQTVSGETQVLEVPTDRGFWVGSGDQRLFALIVDEPREVPMDINQGQTLSIRAGTVRDLSHLPQLEGRPIDADTRAILEEQEIYLVVPEESMEILQPGTS